MNLFMKQEVHFWENSPLLEQNGFPYHYSDCYEYNIHSSLKKGQVY